MGSRCYAAAGDAMYVLRRATCIQEQTMQPDASRVLEAEFRQGLDALLSPGQTQDCER
jgi:hypothetical protein